MDIDEAVIRVETFMRAYLADREAFLDEAYDELDDWEDEDVPPLQLAMVTPNAAGDAIVVFLSCADPLDPRSGGPTRWADESAVALRAALPDIAAHFRLSCGTTLRSGVWAAYRRGQREVQSPNDPDGRGIEPVANPSHPTKANQSRPSAAGGSTYHFAGRRPVDWHEPESLGWLYSASFLTLTDDDMPAVAAFVRDAYDAGLAVHQIQFSGTVMRLYLNFDDCRWAQGRRRHELACGLFDALARRIPIRDAVFHHGIVDEDEDHELVAAAPIFAPYGPQRPVDPKAPGWAPSPALTAILGF